MPLLYRLAFLAPLLPLALAQTWTSCNPLNVTTCPPDLALGTNHTWDFTTGQADSTWNTTNGNIGYGQNGAEFTIAEKGDAPTIQTNFYIFGGEVEVWLKAATGRGVVSSSVLQSDDLDEVDWEFIGSNSTFAETNYYGKGNTTDAISRAKWLPSVDPTADFHNYTVRWTNQTIDWYIDGNISRTLKSDDANGGSNFPQSPMQIKLGIWPGGDPSENEYTIEWAGGVIDYSKGPYIMYVKSIRITDYSGGSAFGGNPPAKEYKYGDKTGLWPSIDITSGNSSVASTLSKPPAESVSQKWNGLPVGAKIGIAAGVVALIVALIGLFICYCVKQRRAGRRERVAEDLAYEKDTAELIQFRQTVGKGYTRI